jgi:hypothetical protein
MHASIRAGRALGLAALLAVAGPAPAGEILYGAEGNRLRRIEVASIGGASCVTRS